MHLVVVRKSTNSSEGNSNSLLRLAFSCGPLTDIVIDGMPLLDGLHKNDVIFASGLGHGINIFYQAMTGSGVRTIHPSPTYPAQSSTESFFAGQPPIFYRCDPDNNWQPDLNDLE